MHNFELADDCGSVVGDKQLFEMVDDHFVAAYGNLIVSNLGTGRVCSPASGPCVYELPSIPSFQFLNPHMSRFHLCKIPSAPTL